ncbi:glucose-6-phosphate isomerase, partial [bacterium]|nr:glucose-6-phosphate isomerase [bacterium]
MNHPADPTADALGAKAMDDLERGGVPGRIWAGDHTVWRDDPTEINNRLGWLGVPAEMRGALGEIRSFTKGLQERGVRDVVLIGMGGSSLAPEVLRQTFGSADGHPRLHVVDSTSPAWIRRVTSQLDPATFHGLVASKSGSTIEVRTLLAHFLEVARGGGIDPPGASFTAITDPGTGLDERATAEHFHATFRNRPDIGGRFSALSHFGLVPAGVLGVNVEALLSGAERMAEACGKDVPVKGNPGAVLGSFLGAAALAGRDKLGLLLSGSVSSFALWIEQLLAESTGKEGRGILPVADEPAIDPHAMGKDRVFVSVRVDGDDNTALDARAAALAQAGHPVMGLRMANREALGGEMFRWEFATAIAGHLLGIHPFDQPDVQSAKTRTQEILAAAGRGEMPASPASERPGPALATLGEGGYAAIHVYGDPDEALMKAIAEWRAAIQQRYRVPTTLGIGPRFLHSTGQLHKGGAPGGVFLQIVLEEGELPIPGEPLGFGQLIR